MMTCAETAEMAVAAILLAAWPPSFDAGIVDHDWYKQMFEVRHTIRIAPL